MGWQRFESKDAISKLKFEQKFNKNEKIRGGNPTKKQNKKDI